MRATEFITEKWSAKYKRSINCDNPRGFSQKAHCAGRKKTESVTEIAKTTRLVKTTDKSQWDEYIVSKGIGKTKQVGILKGYEIHFYYDRKNVSHVYLLKDPNSEKFVGELILDKFAGDDDTFDRLADKSGKSVVSFSPEIQGKGLAVPLYKFVIDRGYTVVSDSEQTKGSQTVWKTLARTPGINVYAWDMYDDYFFDWNPNEDEDEQVYWDSEAAEILKRKYRKGEISQDEYKKEVDKLGPEQHPNTQRGDIRLVATKGKIKTISYGPKGRTVNEAYVLRLENDEDLLVLHIRDTKSGKRTEVRGKSGYESGNYDPNDKLHQLLDKVGKSANISELINGEVVTINPKHPDADKAKKATDVAYNENFADGKVKGKSRPGRVKKAGASCKGSVTDLRAKAKKASGERAKMYHWCANMKSGRKKSKS